MSLIPATILTGFLGSGKTTLLKRVLTEAHGQKIAVIENEFGEENIDNEILVQDAKEQIIQLNNGCVCCTIREDLRTTLADLAEKKRKGELDFDRVVIETTGLADPGPVAQTFFMDDEIAESYLLDSILTLVDAKHGDQQLDDRQEARRQVGFADQIFISKTDLVDGQTVEALIHRIKHMNPRAPQTRVNFGEVPIKDVFDLKGFNLNAKLDIDPDFLKAEEEHGHDHGHEHHDHDQDEHDQRHRPTSSGPHARTPVTGLPGSTRGRTTPRGEWPMSATATSADRQRQGTQGTRPGRVLRPDLRCGAPSGTRTPNPLIKSQLLCQLS